MVELQSGQTLGPYRILNQVGRGGMATVYKAYHAVMDRYVAVKVLSSDMAEDENLRGRFLQEARLIARLEHAHILPVHDFGESDGVYYIVLRYLDTGTLKDRLEAGPLDLDEIDHLFSQLTDALGYAHDHGVLHRDIKPSNVLVDASRNVFLTDFGIAKLVEATIQFTVSGAITGTPSYMSPEQAQGEVLDPRSDIYSLGIILFEMITGQVPFEAETPLAVILKHLQAPLPLPSQIRPNLHPAIERILLKALAKDREDRFSTCQEFLTAWKGALEEARRSTPAQAVEPGLDPHRNKPPASPKAETATVIEDHPSQALIPGKTPYKPPTLPVGGTNKVLRVGAIIVLTVLILAAIWIGMQAAQPGTAPSETQGSISQVQMDEGEGQVATENKNTAKVNIQPQATLIETLTKVELWTPSGPIPQEALFTSWTGANTIFDVQIFDDTIYTSGPGGVTTWSIEDLSILQRITTAVGFSNANVHAFLNEGNQRLWIATENGLFLLNGDQVISNSSQTGLDSEYISAVISLDGKLLAGTWFSNSAGGGLIVLENSLWRIYDSAFPSVYPDEASSNQLSNAVTALLEDGTALWVGTTHGLGRQVGQTWTQYHTSDGLPDESVLTLFLDHAGQLVVGTEGGAAIFDGLGFETLPQGPPDGVYGIAESPQGVYWLSGGGGIWRYDSENNAWQAFSYETGHLPVYGMYNAQADPEGNIYVGSDGAGLVVVRPDLTIDFARVPDTPTGASFASILPGPGGEPDSPSTLWFLSTDSTSVDVFDLQTSEWLEPVEDLEGFPIYVDHQNRLWTNEWPSGFWMYTPQGEAIHITERQGLPPEAYVNSVSVSDDTAWLGTSAGLAQFDGEKIVQLIPGTQLGLEDDMTNQIFMDADDTLWVTGFNDLAHRTPDGSWEVFGYQNPFRNEWVEVFDINQDQQGGIWIATNEGAYRFADESWMLFTYGDPKVDLPSPAIICITSAPDGSMWFGTERGAARFDGANWQSFGAGPEGLISGYVNDILVLADGEVFFATAGGVSRIRP